MRPFLPSLGTMLLLVASTSPALAQDTRLLARLDSATAAAVQAVVDSAASEGIPGEPLVQKALEGETLGAPSAQILWAVRSLRTRLATARKALGPHRGVDELAAAAAVLGAGAEPDVLLELAARLPAGSAGLPLVVMADLIQRGVSPQGAARAVLSLADARVDVSGYAQLRVRVEEDINRGEPPEAAAQARARGIVLRRPGGGEG